MVRKLIAWYRKNKRDLPWRKTRDPYRIMVSEFMLVQTTVATVVKRYELFLKEFPTIQTLAEAPLWKVKKAWTGLGYNSRAVNLHRAAQEIVRQGNFPANPEDLKTLPGFGPYLANAVSSIAFEAPAPVLDTNVRRVILRLLNTEDPGTLDAMLVESRALPSEFNQAMMELGALICRAREPRCHACPVRAFCATEGVHPVEQKPAASQKLELFIRVHQDKTGRVLLERRGPGEKFLKNTWGLPATVIDRCPPGNGLKTLTHAIMRWRIHAHVDHAQSDGLKTTDANKKWVPEKQLGRYLFSSLWWKALTGSILLALAGCASPKVKDQPATQKLAVEIPVPEEPAPAAAKPKETMTVVAAGDVLLASMSPEPPSLPPHDGRGLYDEVKPYLKGDIIFANLESAVTDNCSTEKCRKSANKKGKTANISPKGCYQFATPARYAKTMIEAGFNVVSINNNHSLDCGGQGYLDMVTTLNNIGLRYAGKKNEIAEFYVAGASAAVIAFGFTGGREFPSVLNIPEAVLSVANLKARFPIVIVSFHGGAEGLDAMRLPQGMEIFENTKRGDLRAFAHALVDAGAALVIGHGPHVPRAMELYKNRLIAYSLGNFQTYGKMNLADQRAYAPMLSVELHVRDGSFRGGRIVSFIQKEPGIPLFDPQVRAAKLIKELGRKDIANNLLEIAPDGGLKALEEPKKYIPPVKRVPIGATAKSKNNDFRMTLSARFQHYNRSPEHPRDRYDVMVQSPKSAGFRPDGTKAYVNSLEGFTTVAYDPVALKQLGTIRHCFDEKNAGLISSQKPFDYAFIVKPKSGDVDHFCGKPVEMAFSHEGRFLWVSYYRRDYDEFSQNPSAVAVIDTQTDAIVTVLPSGPIPKFITPSPDGRWMAFVHWGDNTVGFVDIRGADPSKFRLSHLVAVEKRLNLSDLETETNGEKIDRDSECGLCLRGAAFTKDSRHLLIGRLKGGGVAVIDVAKRRYIGTVWGMRPTPRHLVLHPDGKWLYTSSNVSGYISKLNVQEIIGNASGSHEVKPAAEVFAGSGARTIDLSPNGRWVFAAVNTDSKLVALNAENLTKVAEVPADSFPVGLAVSPDNAQVWVTSQGRELHGGNSVSVYRIETE
ncbi:MAG: CapA family protein [Elusimicrobia bacterium]|nr:CapA family protein [Elusimicrobiota bacterium]